VVSYLRTCRRCHWPLASHFIKTISKGLFLRAELLYISARVEMGPALAIVMNRLAVKHFWPSETVEFRQFAEKQVIYYDSCKEFNVHGAEVKVDNSLVDSHFFKRL